MALAQALPRQLIAKETAYEQLVVTSLIGQKLALQIGIGIRGPPMLAQVLGNHEPFDHLLRMGAVFGHTSHICWQSKHGAGPHRT